MSDQPIEAGDLALVYRPSRCGSTKNIGRIFFVERVIEAAATICVHCGDEHGQAVVAMEDAEFGFEVGRLRRIDPDAGLGETPTRVESVSHRGGGSTSRSNSKPDRLRPDREKIFPF